MLFLAVIGLYVVWPSLVATFSSVDELKHVAPGWFVVMAACEALSYGCIWLLIGLCLGSRRYFAIGAAQVVGNSVSKIVPGGSPMGAATQYRMLVGAGMDAARIGTGHDGRLADQRGDAVRPARARGARDRRRGRRRSGPRARRLARCRGVRPARRWRRGAAAARPADRRRRPRDRADPQHAAAPSPADGRPRPNGSRAERDTVRATARRAVGPGDPAVGGQRRCSTTWRCWRRSSRRAPGRARRSCCSPTSRRSCWA